MLLNRGGDKSKWSQRDPILVSRSTPSCSSLLFHWLHTGTVFFLAPLLFGFEARLLTALSQYCGRNKAGKESKNGRARDTGLDIDTAGWSCCVRLFHMTFDSMQAFRLAQLELPGYEAFIISHPKTVGDIHQHQFRMDDGQGVAGLVQH